MIKDLIKAAAELDGAGFHVEADLMDKIMQKVAQKMESEEDEEVESEEDEEIEEDPEEIEEDPEEIDFGFIGEESEESEDDFESGDHSVEECLDYCKDFSNEKKVELIKALLDSMME